MLKWLRRLQAREEGITLIELIVTVAIIGVLAYLIVPRVLATLDESKMNSAESVANEIHAAMERYAAQQNKYPTAIANWAAVGTTLDVSVSDNTRIVDSATFKYTNASADVFCASFTAKDRAGTIFKVTKSGVEKGAAAACS